MISFYPGPSHVYDAIPTYVNDASRLGILSMNHRSDSFMRLYKNTVYLLRKKLNIPVRYSVFFSSSATECWEMIAQSVMKRESLHVYNGSFGEKWHNHTQRIQSGARALYFDPEEEIPVDKITAYRSELICLTQNETSNGTQISQKLMTSIRKQNPKALIAVDATSSMAGVELDFKRADIWFASVQKCFGLPAGLAVMVCSPSAIKCIKSINETRHYNSLVNVYNMMERWQTTHTPNVLGIYLLMRVLKDTVNISRVSKKIERQARDWQQFFRTGKALRPYILNEKVHSNTVIAVTGNPDWIAKVKSDAAKKGFVLGEGYGHLKQTTFRIANFPAIRKNDIRALRHFLKSYL